jgi:YesN/AraC family two-component response regulator
MKIRRLNEEEIERIRIDVCSQQKIANLRKRMALSKEDLDLAFSFYKECLEHRKMEDQLRAQNPEKAENLIRKKFKNHTHVNLESLAKTFGISKSYLSSKFRERMRREKE